MTPDEMSPDQRTAMNDPCDRIDPGRRIMRHCEGKDAGDRIRLSLLDKGACRAAFGS